VKPIKFEDFLKQITVVIDQQEKVNYWITNYFKDNNISFTVQYMKAGDYGYIFNSKPQPIIIERKNSLTELSGNLSTEEKRTRFYNEFGKLSKCEKYLLIENDNIDNLIAGTYGSKYNQNSFIANFLLLQRRYKLNIYFVNRYNMGFWILKIFYYHYYENIKDV
jgi:ERCC4-type nuclease